MIGAIKDRVERYLGRGRHSIAVPVMDGPMHPNHRLDQAEDLLAVPQVDNLTNVDGELWFSSDVKLMHHPVDAEGPQTVETFEAPVTCLAASPDRALAVGLDGKGILLRGGAHDGTRIETLGGKALSCPTAALFLDKDTLVVTIGAADRLHADWKRDLMARGRTGQVWQIDLPSGNATQLAGGLAYPYGICQAPQGLVVSEAWEHRLVVLENGKVRPVLEDLPGYPARIAAAADGGYALAIFAPRNQLVEFVLREPEFLHVMTTTVHPDNWIAPKLMWGQGFKEPMQGAALKTMGIIKPWAPTWSYGLVVALDEGLAPVASFHSRADGHRHGVTSVCMLGGKLLAAAKGAGVVVAIEQQQAAEAH